MAKAKIMKIDKRNFGIIDYWIKQSYKENERERRKQGGRKKKGRERGAHGGRRGRIILWFVIGIALPICKII